MDDLAGARGRIIGELAAAQLKVAELKALLARAADGDEHLARPDVWMQTSESFASLLFDSITDKITVQDTEYNIVRVNRVVEETFGPDLIGKKCYQAYQGRDLVCPDCAMAKALATGQPAFSAEQPGPDGFWVEVWAFPIKDSDGNMIGALEHGRDITDRKRAQKQLRQREQVYSTLVEKGNDGILVVQDRIVKFANSKATEMLGGTKEEMTGKPFLDILPPSSKELILDRYERRLAGENVPKQYETELASGKGTIIPVELSMSLIEYEGRPASMAIV
ncbi:MAG: PAS domain S-box protein, partial [Dehalococcoidia bacterium]|nr:PAS domain S-box protein [Dehalococcoidia bacterium]